MADKNIQMQILNGSGAYDALYPKTLGQNTIISDSVASEMGLSSGATVDQALSTFQSNTDKIGDVKYSFRTLGQNYLPCNGATISKNDYPELTQLLFNPYINYSQIEITPRKFSYDKISQQYIWWNDTKYWLSKELRGPYTQGTFGSGYYTYSVANYIFFDGTYWYSITNNGNTTGQVIIYYATELSGTWKLLSNQYTGYGLDYYITTNGQIWCWSGYCGTSWAYGIIKANDPLKVTTGYFQGTHTNNNVENNQFSSVALINNVWHIYFQQNVTDTDIFIKTTKDFLSWSSYSFKPHLSTNFYIVNFLYWKGYYLFIVRGVNDSCTYIIFDTDLSFSNCQTLKLSNLRAESESYIHRAFVTDTNQLALILNNGLIYFYEELKDEYIWCFDIFETTAVKDQNSNFMVFCNWSAGGAAKISDNSIATLPLSKYHYIKAK